MLFAQITAVTDTLVVRQVPDIRTGFEQVVFVASGLTSIIVLVLVIAALLAILALRRKIEETQGQLAGLLSELRPMAASAKGAIEDFREVAGTAKDTIVETRIAIQDTHTRIQETVDTLADRVDDLSDILGRVHRSAETVAAIAGTAIGGIKLGARAFGIGGSKKRPKRKRPLSRAAARRQRLAEDAEDDERPRLRRRD
jgi:methyl-accepting chemotaxis protein